MSALTTDADLLTGSSLIGAADVRPDGRHVPGGRSRHRGRTGPAVRGGRRGGGRASSRLADQAFADYRRTTAEQRAAFLESIAANIEALGGTLSERVTAETGLPAGRVAGETARTAGQLRLFAALVRDGGWRQVRIDEARPDRTPLPRPDLRQRAVPLGPVAVFGASNFPLAFSVAGGDTASALAAGCPVIVKAPPRAPRNLRAGGSRDPGRRRRARSARGDVLAAAGHRPRAWHALVSDPRIKAVGFTGSRPAAGPRGRRPAHGRSRSRSMPRCPVDEPGLRAARRPRRAGRAIGAGLRRLA